MSLRPEQPAASPLPELTYEDFFLLLEITESPRAIYRCTTLWLIRMLGLCGKCEQVESLEELIRTELAHRRGR